jgi:hypothetical protein
MRNISLSPQENLERCVLRRNDGARFRIVADAPAACEPGLGGRGRTCADGRVCKCEHVGLLFRARVRHRLGHGT